MVPAVATLALFALAVLARPSVPEERSIIGLSEVCNDIDDAISDASDLHWPGKISMHFLPNYGILITVHSFSWIHRRHVTLGQLQC